MIKRNAVAAALLAAGMAMSLIGCGSDAAGTTSVQDTQARETVLGHSPDRSPEGGTHIVMDHTGREIETPAGIDRIIILSLLPLPSVYNLFEGSTEKLVGVHPSSMTTAGNSILPKVVPDILDVDMDFLQGGGLNIEELPNLRPDVVFYNANNTEEYEKLAAAGVPAVGFPVSNQGFDYVTTFENWVKLLGKVPDQEDKAAGIAGYGYQVYNEVQAMLNGAGDIEKPGVLILFNYANGVIKASDSNFFEQYQVRSTGDINVAMDPAGTPEINVEQIYEWNPNIIYITGFSPYLPENLYDNTIEGHDWSSVKAVKEGEAYKSPLGMYRWFPPTSDTPLVLRWLAQKDQPQLFADVDMEQEVHAYYKRFCSVALPDKDITQVFNPAREVAGS